jgi:hypothetical protein
LNDRGPLRVLTLDGREKIALPMRRPFDLSFFNRLTPPVEKTYPCRSILRI